MSQDEQGARKAARKAARAAGSGATGERKSARKQGRVAKEGKPEEAVIAQLRRIERNPEQGAGYVRTLPLLVKLKLPRLAEMIGQKALSVGINNPGVYLWLARAKRAEGDRSGALSAVAAGLAAHPDSQQLQKLKARLEESPAG